MNSENLISEGLIADYQRNGVVCLRGVFRDWVERLERGMEENLRQPGPLAKQPAPGFFEDFCNWENIADYRDFVLNSNAAEIAARLMGSRGAQFYHEHVIIKEPGTPEVTPWHQDQPYYNVDGEQTVSFWIPLDPVPESVCLRCAAGSHRHEKLFEPVFFKDSRPFYSDMQDFEPIPDLDADPGAYRQVIWDLEPGDAIAFNFKTLHAAPGNETASRRRAFSARWLGDDVRYAQRSGVTSPPFPDIGLEPGDPMREDWFPMVWRRGGQEA